MVKVNIIDHQVKPVYENKLKEGDVFYFGDITKSKVEGGKFVFVTKCEHTCAMFCIHLESHDLTIVDYESDDLVTLTGEKMDISINLKRK